MQGITWSAPTSKHACVNACAHTCTCARIHIQMHTCTHAGTLIILAWVYLRRPVPALSHRLRRANHSGRANHTPAHSLPSPTAVWWLFCHYALTALLLTATLYMCILCCESLLRVGMPATPAAPHAARDTSMQPSPAERIAMDAALRAHRCAGKEGHGTCAAAELALYVQHLEQQLAHMDTELRQKVCPRACACAQINA